MLSKLSPLLFNRVPFLFLFFLLLLYILITHYLWICHHHMRGPDLPYHRERIIDGFLCFGQEIKPFHIVIDFIYRTNQMLSFFMLLLYFKQRILRLFFTVWWVLLTFFMLLILCKMPEKWLWLHKNMLGTCAIITSVWYWNFAILQEIMPLILSNYFSVQPILSTKFLN